MPRLSLRQRTRTATAHGLDAARIKNPFLRRAIPPLVIAAIVILLSWLLGLPPHPTLVVLLAVTYALYLLPPRARRIALPATVLALAVAYPIIWANDQLDPRSWLFQVPIVGDLPSMDTMVTIAIFAMMAIGLNMVVGYAGLLDLGYVAFYAIGAYTAAWLASPHFGRYGTQVNFGGIDVPKDANGNVLGIHLSIWMVLVIAAIITAVAGVLIGLPTLRLRGDYLAIVTLGFGEIVHVAAQNGDADGIGKLLDYKGNHFNLTNGAFGITPIDPPGFGSWLGSNVHLPSSFLTAYWPTTGSHAGTYVTFVNLMYWGGLALLVITIFCSIRLRDSRLGRAWIAIREDEVAAAAMGIPLMRTKTWAYASGAFFGGVAGAWYASFKTGVFADDFLFQISIFILCMVILGGMGNVWGVLAGAVVLTFLNFQGLAQIADYFNSVHPVFGCDPNAQDPSKPISHGCFNAPLLQTGIYGAILVLVMLFRPGGLIPEQRRKLEFETGVHDEPLMDVRGAPEA
jgi:branched-chain amino acid transport system permease protein